MSGINKAVLYRGCTWFISKIHADSSMDLRSTSKNYTTKISKHDQQYMYKAQSRDYEQRRQKRQFTSSDGYE